MNNDNRSACVPNFTGEYEINELNKDIKQVETFLEECQKLVAEKSFIHEDELESKLPDINTWIDSMVENQRDMFRKLIKGYKCLYIKFQKCKDEMNVVQKENYCLKEEKRVEEQLRHTLKTDLNDLQIKYNQLEREKAKLNKFCEKLQLDIKTKHKNIDRLNELLSIKDNSLWSLKKELEKSGIELKNNQDNTKKLECQLSQMQDNLNQINSECSEKDNCYHEAITTIQKELSKQLKEVMCMECKLAEKEKIFQEMSKEICQLNSIIESIKSARDKDGKLIESYVKSIKMENEKMRQKLLDQFIDTNR
ncbi:repetitive organellar protein-like [Daktulosphaira vitifoliae]|uniref:repetitive organellar protein-like n=1 Tax=Daktulosphaira vitifoliae TaxID=58002 RepID=UPI0021AAB82A|nr:repetitive organellar protein-like [Daktulosphaira vitifoliae]